MAVRLAAALALAVTAALVAVGAARAGRASLHQRLVSALRVEHVNLAAAGVSVVDLRTGRTVFAHNASRSLRPASNEKLAVTYAALTTLGPGFRIETDVFGEGTRNGSTWRGDLVLKGYGDPSLTRAGLASLAHQVRSAGIVQVTGRVLGDESWFDTRRTGRGWKPSFFRHESPPLSALVVNRGWNGHVIVPTPALQAAKLFAVALRRAGVAIGGRPGLGTASPHAVELAEHDSPTVAALVRFMNHESDNFTAEMLTKEIGAVHGDRGTTAQGIAIVKHQLAAAGVPMTGVRLVDGSGLSRFDRWTPTALVTLLRIMREEPGIGPVLLASLPIAGRTGTLADRMRTGPARGLVRAKTGWTRNASSLSGFVGDRYVFSVLENGWPVSWSWSHLSQDRFAAVLAALTRARR